MTQACEIVKKLMEIGLCICTHTMVFPTHLKAFSTNSLTLCTSPVAMTKSSGSFSCSINHIAWKRQTETERLKHRDHKDSSALHTGLCPTWSWQTGSEPVTSRRGRRPYLCPDVTAGAHGTNTVGKEDIALPQAHCAAGTHENKHMAMNAHTHTYALICTNWHDSLKNIHKTDEKVHSKVEEMVN